jgi:hypothetical protein
VPPKQTRRAKPKGTAHNALEAVLDTLVELTAKTGHSQHVSKVAILALLGEHGRRVPRKRTGPRPRFEPLTVAQLASRPAPPKQWVSPYVSWGTDAVAERFGHTLRRPRRLD